MTRFKKKSDYGGPTYPYPTVLYWPVIDSSEAPEFQASPKVGLASRKQGIQALDDREAMATEIVWTW